MHMLMSFVGAIGTLMTETGLAQILETVFGGVAKMLTGKKISNEHESYVYGGRGAA